MVKPIPKLPDNQLHLLGMPLQVVESYKCLGLLLASNMSWSPHIESICNKARQILGLLYRRFYDSTDSSMIKQLYLSMVRPHLEYACQVWDPHLIRDKHKLESARVQKFGLKFAARRWVAGYNELLDLFNLPTLYRGA